MYRGISIKETIELNVISEFIKEITADNNIDWYIEEIEASGNLTILGTSMLELINEAKKGDFGKKVTTEFILNLLPLIDSLDSFLLLGGKINSKYLNFEKHESVYLNVEYVFEFFDSMEWNITSLEHNFSIRLESFFLTKKNITDYTLLEGSIPPSNIPPASH
jgi:hypothetical protein